MPTCLGTTPDYTRLKTALDNGKPDRVPLYEFFSDTTVQFTAIERYPREEDTLPLGDNEDLNKHIIAQYYMGYDYVSPHVMFGFSQLKYVTVAAENGQTNVRHFLDEKDVAISNREDFEKYPWPTPDVVDYSDLEYCAAHLPDGMKIVANLGGGLLEWGMWLMGAENFLLALYDEPELVRDVLARVNEQQIIVSSQAASHPDVIACALGDDMGFKTQTFLPPGDMRGLVLPGLKNVVEAVHAHEKSFILHSCGNLAEVMDDLIDYVGIDAKHSFEDVITPVIEAQELWGSRIAMVGGVDIDVLCRASEAELRACVRNIVQTCGAKGGFAIGSGNSIADYVPPESLRIMLEEAILCQA